MVRLQLQRAVAIVRGGRTIASFVAAQTSASERVGGVRFELDGAIPKRDGFVVTHSFTQFAGLLVDGGTIAGWRRRRSWLWRIGLGADRSSPYRPAADRATLLLLRGLRIETKRVVEIALRLRAESFLTVCDSPSQVNLCVGLASKRLRRFLDRLIEFAGIQRQRGL